MVQDAYVQQLLIKHHMEDSKATVNQDLSQLASMSQPAPHSLEERGGQGRYHRRHALRDDNYTVNAFEGVDQDLRHNRSKCPRGGPSVQETPVTRQDWLSPR